jgi:hypothetical protein
LPSAGARSGQPRRKELIVFSRRIARDRRGRAAAVVPPLLAAVIACALAGCGGGSSEQDFPTIGAARTFELAQFRPGGAIQPGAAAAVSFVIRQPDGQPLTRFRGGAGPHTGVHLIFVRDDLGAIVHQHPPVGTGGRVSTKVTLPGAGRYRLVVDVYPASGPQRNFQLFRDLRVAGTAPRRTVPAQTRVVESGGYRFAIRGLPKVKAIEATSLTIDVTDRRGRRPSFAPYFGALAHAIFFRRGTLDYFHTHVCAPGAAGCASTLGGAQVTGRSTRPGRLTVGVLLPGPGTWRLFLQTRIGGRVVTAPFTLNVT